MGFTDIGEDNQPVSFQQTFEQKKVEHREELQRKEDEMKQTFVLRVKEKEVELKEVEKELLNKYDAWKRENTDEKKRYDDLKKRLEDERAEFMKRKHQVSTQQLSSHTMTLGKKKK
ncbi:Septin-2 [Portunus trituberculatus]|uniref:Septin-2 n=2 Tax=Portunus trituberculatus TaxID=210409 RepID=A0A5B7IRL1_PORTR|nr:Septin-2 [Portunus trituberculatus]